MTDAQHPEPRPQNAPPGFYVAGPGPRRYWDGTAWTDRYEDASSVTADEKTIAMVSHLLAIAFSILGPLIIYLIKKDESPYVRHHAAQALNFGITVLIGYIVGFVSMFVLIGFLLLPVIAVAALVFHVLAAIAANNGEWYRYPVNLEFVR